MTLTIFKQIYVLKLLGKISIVKFHFFIQLVRSTVGNIIHHDKYMESSLSTCASYWDIKDERCVAKPIGSEWHCQFS